MFTNTPILFLFFILISEGFIYRIPVKNRNVLKSKRYEESTNSTLNQMLRDIKNDIQKIFTAENDHIKITIVFDKNDMLSKNSFPEMSPEERKMRMNEFIKRQTYFESFNHPKSNIKQNVRSESFEVLYNNKVNFSHVGGYDDIKKELRQIIDLILNKDKYAKYDIKTPKGLLLEGPPGTGKTLISKAFAGEVNFGFISTSGSEFTEKYVGVGPMRIRELITLAKENKPCIIYIDEIDTIGKKRGESTHDENSGTLTALLSAMDGFTSLEDIFFIFSTNRPEILDPALTRSGRVDKKIYVGYPDAETRKAIIDINLKNKPHNLDIEYLVVFTEGTSAADISTLFNEAMLHALRNSRTKIELYDVNIAYNRILSGSSSAKHTPSYEELLQIAVHEMGHAIVGLTCKNYSPLLRVIFNPDSHKIPGYAVFKMGGGIPTKEYFEESIMVSLGGRVAEEILCKSITTGASSDLEEVISKSNEMVIKYGFETFLGTSYSQKSLEEIDDLSKKIISEAYSKTKLIVEENKEDILKYALILMQKKQLFANEIILSQKAFKKY